MKVIPDPATAEASSGKLSDERRGEPSVAIRARPEVSKQVARGHTGQEIADRLGLSVKTVETYRARLMEKLGLHSRAALVRIALEKVVLEKEEGGARNGV